MDIALTVVFMQEIKSEGSPYAVQTLSFLGGVGSELEHFLPFPLVKLY